MKEKAGIKDSDNIRPMDHGIIAKPHTPVYKMHRFFPRWRSASVITLTIGMVLFLFMLPVFSIFGEDTPQKQASKQHEWIGEKIIFLPDYLLDYYSVCYFRSEGDIGEHCLCFFLVPRENLFCPTKEQLAGKTAEIVRMEISPRPEKEKFLWKKFLFTTVIRLEESGTLLYATQVGKDSFDLYLDLTLPSGTAPLSYLKEGKKYIGKTVWSKQDISFSVRKLEKVTVVDVGWGPYRDKPLTFYLERSDGEIECWSGSVIKRDYKFNQIFDHVFDKEWYLTDPHKLHPNWRQRVWRAIEKKQIYIGMTKEMVLMSWGSPKAVNRTIGKWGVHEQWIYSSGIYFRTVRYLYFENGELTTIQD